MSETSRRVLFVDLGRAVAVLFMIQGHTIAVLLGPEYQGGAVFNFWLYLRGLTSCAFLILSGFSFSLATDRHWADYQAATPRLRRRLMRFGIFLLLGYAMRIPVRPLSKIGQISAEQWQAFTAVDILQIVAITLASLQLLAWLAGTRRRLAVGALAACAAVVLLTPLAWKVDWTSLLPVVAASYMSAATGSIFPLFPWAAYILFGAALGAWFVSDGRSHASGDGSRLFLLAGASMIGAAVVLNRVPLSPYGDIEFWATSPNLFLMKAGSVLLLLAPAVWLTKSRAALPRLVSVLSRESLTIYFVHVCILYGSIWNDGLFQTIGPRLGLLPTIGWILFLLVAMSGLAWLWHECKRTSSHFSALVRAALVLALFYAIA
jgi:uncharacterized membrane protein